MHPELGIVGSPPGSAKAAVQALASGSGAATYVAFGVFIGVTLLTRSDSHTLKNAGTQLRNR